MTFGLETLAITTAGAHASVWFRSGCTPDAGP